MKPSEIKELSTPEILERIDDFKKVLTRMRLNHAVSPMDNPNKIGQTKKDIARLKTELRSRQINENK
ncbi:MAG TPA: 50S ribosomal protein L29 [Marinilabiliales bacterium]|jgi:large subunit ribosomal protein L29|nr:50S ribosomal protein L29 [Salinivirgaceae bacterium]OFX37508.1 MAG: 50S ribosomal protein L29 [Bacteroidetes bacterium GWA2_40_14]OFX62627.1 MAG: 50S ribosomal protein L29 [Bacteroidetes bacterium GWC2_40_13]OFX74377.1 MAG: 50S ribosomal protein L29 [Bacteroidetes bacterium GWD2_40_43]OFX95210.1 MAG: 50S ribosomal protein L29 [Bacteroidetes bacterium GWE2_40_63]OFY21102.1 MAG: 50S ribosomal protein L29 [Bacteroidetes bacterium GWF2_40_13]OFZ30876.1 MAG: 50S ribosomal protein L29 [Bacteroi